MVLAGVGAFLNVHEGPHGIHCRIRPNEEGIKVGNSLHTAVVSLKRLLIVRSGNDSRNGSGNGSGDDSRNSSGNGSGNGSGSGVSRYAVLSVNFSVCLRIVNPFNFGFLFLSKLSTRSVIVDRCRWA